MKWTVDIEGKELDAIGQPILLKNQRIVVEFIPLNESLLFTGQFKYKNEWQNFSEEIISMKTTGEEILNALEKTYNSMKARINAYNEIAEGFTAIRAIGVKED